MDFFKNVLGSFGKGVRQSVNLVGQGFPEPGERGASDRSGLPAEVIRRLTPIHSDFLEAIPATSASGIFPPDVSVFWDQPKSCEAEATSGP